MRTLIRGPMGFFGFVIALVLVAMVTVGITTRFSGDGVAPTHDAAVSDISQAVYGLGDTVVQPTITSFWSNTVQAPTLVATHSGTYGYDQLTSAPATTSPGMWLLATGMMFVLAALSCQALGLDPFSHLRRYVNRATRRLIAGFEMALRRSGIRSLGRVALNSSCDVRKVFSVLVAAAGFGIIAVGIGSILGASTSTLVIMAAPPVLSIATVYVIDTAVRFYSEHHEHDGTQRTGLGLWQARFQSGEQVLDANDLTRGEQLALIISTTSASTRASPANFTTGDVVNSNAVATRGSPGSSLVTRDHAARPNLVLAVST